MTSRFAAATLFTLAAACAGSAAAQPIRPGLWQMQMTTPGMPKGMNPMAGQIEMLKKQMASMPAADRKEMEKVIAELQAKDTEFTADGLRTKECITKENLAKFDLFSRKNTDSCTRTVSPVQNGVMRVSAKCTQPPATMNAVARFQSEKAYTFESTITMNDATGKSVTHKSTGSGKWLSDDCGAVKPATLDE